METGIVKFFDEREGKKFGFLTVLDESGNPTQEEIFFHYNDGYQLQNWGASEPEWPYEYGFTAHDAPKLDGTMHVRKMPRQDDKVVFERAEGNQGRDKAKPWDYAQHYDELVKEIAAEREREEYPERFEECRGGCGQTVATCTCAELASFRAHNSMTDGYWTA